MTRPAPHAGTPQTGVDGVAVGRVVHAGSTEQVAEAMAEAERDGHVVAVRGAGTKLAWAPPPESADVLIDVSGMDSVLSHAAGDLVLRAQPGAGLAEVNRQLTGHDQRLALDEVVPGSTLGGIVATGLSGPLRYSFGTPRDLLIGITVVLADGTVAHAGGTVVKNVAGYDLGKLFTGSLGTLGVITELVFRLHPRPREARWVRMEADGSSAAAAVSAARASQTAPAAIGLDRPAGGEAGEVAVLIEGVPEGVAHRAQMLRAELSEAAGRPAAVDSEPPPWWGVLPDAAGALASASHDPAQLGRLLAEAPPELALRGEAGSGVLWAGMPPSEAGALLERLRVLCGRLRGHAVLRLAPPEVERAVDAWGPTPALELMRAVKDQFDPQRRLAPGRFVGGL